MTVRLRAAGKSSFDVQLPATYEVLNSAVNISMVGNVAAGSHRLVSRQPPLAMAFLESVAACMTWWKQFIACH